MAKSYRFYNDAKTVDSEYISDNMGSHETFFIEELRSVDSADVQAGLNIGVEPITETELTTLAVDSGLTLAVFNDGTFSEYLNSLNNILDFSFAEETPESLVIDPVAFTIDIEVVALTAVTALVATFQLSEGATAKIGATAQVSGTTANDFTSDVTYIITSANGVAQNWVVTVTVAA